MLDNFDDARFLPSGQANGHGEAVWAAAARCQPQSRFRRSAASRGFGAGCQAWGAARTLGSAAAGNSGPPSGVLQAPPLVGGRAAGRRERPT